MSIFQLLRRWRSVDSSFPRAPVLPSYRQSGWINRNRRKMLFGLFVALFFYSALFILLGRFLLVQFIAPLALLILLIIWALPDREKVPDKLLQALFLAFVVGQLFWPNYLALSLGNLPWITAVRLIGVPMVFIMLICLSQSHAMRATLSEILGANKLTARLMLALIGLAVLSLAFSTDRGMSTNLLIAAIFSWFALFYVALLFFARPGNVERFIWLLWTAVIFWCLMGVWESRISQVPWANSIPSFLKIEDEVVQRVLSGSARSATGIYRVQGKFTTSLSMAEFMALSAPFIIHFLMTSRFWLYRIAAATTLPFMFWLIIATDSRLGVVGFFLSILSYIGIWAVRRWKHADGSLFGPAITLAYPVLFAMFIIATFTVGRLRNMVWGTGAQAASNEARQVQIEMGLSDLAARPWGYGIGRAADALGFASPSGILTIDNYYLSVALELGVIGFFIYYGMFFLAIAQGARVGIHETDEARLWIVPASLALANFFIIKSVLSQQEGHPLAFIILAMVMAIIWASPHRDAPLFGVPRLRHSVYSAPNQE